MEKGQVLSQHGDRSYVIQGENGGLYTRNRVDLRPSAIPFELKCEPDITVPKDDCVTPMPLTPNTPMKSAVETNFKSTPPPVENLRPKRALVIPKRYDGCDTSGWR